MFEVIAPLLEAEGAGALVEAVGFGAGAERLVGAAASAVFAASAVLAASVLMGAPRTSVSGCWTSDFGPQPATTHAARQRPSKQVDCRPDRIMCRIFTELVAGGTGSGNPGFGPALPAFKFRLAQPASAIPSFASVTTSLHSARPVLARMRVGVEIRRAFRGVLPAAACSGNSCGSSPIHLQG